MKTIKELETELIKALDGNKIYTAMCIRTKIEELQKTDKIKRNVEGAQPSELSPV